MASYEILHDSLRVRGQTVGFPAVCCTYSSSSLHKEQRQHLDRSGPSCQLLLQLQHEPPNPDKHPTSPAELSPSLLHSQAHSKCMGHTGLTGKKSSQMTQL